MADLDGYIYIIGSPEPLSIKLGYTKGSPIARMKQLQTGNPVRLKLFGWFPGSLEMEREFHARLAPFRLEGEWFKVGPEAEEAIGGPWLLMDINNRLTGYDPEWMTL